MNNTKSHNTPQLVIYSSSAKCSRDSVDAKNLVPEKRKTRDILFYILYCRKLCG